MRRKTEEKPKKRSKKLLPLLFLVFIFVIFIEVELEEDVKHENRISIFKIIKESLATKA